MKPVLALAIFVSASLFASELRLKPGGRAIIESNHKTTVLCSKAKCFCTEPGFIEVNSNPRKYSFNVAGPIVGNIGRSDYIYDSPLAALRACDSWIEKESYCRVSE